MLFELEAAAAEQKKTEIKLLRWQINPHFIYNALDNVNCRLMMGILGLQIKYQI